MELVFIHGPAASGKLTVARALAAATGFGVFHNIPLHRDFEEVNLRFYVRRKTPEGWRRAVVFIKELVPRTAIALTARIFYGENYVAVPMSHRIEVANGSAEAVRRVSYRWRFEEREHEMRITARGEARDVATGSEEEFITEHYWGYAQPGGHGLVPSSGLSRDWKPPAAPDESRATDRGDGISAMRFRGSTRGVLSG